MSVKNRNLTPANQSSDKLLSMLEKLTVQSEPLRLQDIAEICGMNSSTALRFLTALKKRNYIAQDIDSGKYYITYKICALAQNISTYNNIRNIALPFMRSVANEYKESCNLAVENDMSILYVEVVNSPYNTLLSTQRIGNIAPMHCTGIGKLFLSEYSLADMDRYKVLKTFAKYTEHTIIDQKDLSPELLRIKELNYALDNEECEVGVRCVAVPIRDYTGKIYAGLSVSGPSVRMTDKHIYTHLNYLQNTANQISISMGWNNI